MRNKIPTVLETHHMEVRIDRDTFLDGVQKVQGIAETKGAMPILRTCFLLLNKIGLAFKQQT